MKDWEKVDEERAFHLFTALCAAALHVDIDAKTGELTLPSDQVNLHELAELSLRAVRAFDEVVIRRWKRSALDRCEHCGR